MLYMFDVHRVSDLALHFSQVFMKVVSNHFRSFKQGRTLPIQKGEDCSYMFLVQNFIKTV